MAEFDLKKILAEEKICYCIGCGCNLLLKICLTMTFGFCGVSIRIGYFASHVLILLFGFVFHYFVTFRRRFESWRRLFLDFGKFSSTLLFINAIDYLLVVILVPMAEARLLMPETADWVRQLFRGCGIGVISTGIFVLRFFLYRMVLRRKNTVTSENGMPLCDQQQHESRRYASDGEAEHTQMR